MADRTIPDAGFDREGKQVIDYGPRQFIATLQDDFSIHLTNAEGKTIKDLPSANKAEDEEEIKQSKKEFSASKKELKQVLKLQKERLYEAMCTQRTWPYEDWNRYINQHPIMGRYSQRLVWLATRDQEPFALFRSMEDRSLTDVEDNEIRLKDDDLISIAHQSILQLKMAEAWLGHFQDYEVQPLFAQFGRNTFELKPELQKKTAIDSFEGHMINSYKLHSVAQKLGYTRGSAEDGGWFYTYFKSFPGIKIQAVKTFIVGNPDEKGTKGGKGQITRKFYGNDTLVERAIVTLLGNRGLLLVGEPGTAKSLLSELLTAAISGDSQLTVQGTAGTTEDQIKYSWNYALLLAHGPSRESLVPGPVYRAMAEGKIVRFEEITRCQPEIQDTLVSLLSDKVLMVPELRGEEVTLQAKKGFNILATANLRDRGVNEMSSALKRRFNFETVLPIADPELEMEIVRKETDRLLADSGIHQPMPEDAMELLITTFRDLRSGKTREGATIEKPSTVMSTAEAVAVSFAACLDAHYFGAGKVSGRHISRHMLGTVFKDDPSDAKKLRHYLTVIGKVRAKQGGAWHEFYETKAEWDSN